MPKYTTKKIAELVGVHPNTVRVYEDWGYISPVTRLDNGYRQYSEIHLLQLKIIRLAFRHELLQKDFRKKAISIIKASGNKQFDLALVEATNYLRHLQLEHQYVLKTIAIAEQWSNSMYSADKKPYTHQEVARLLGITEEVLRNWERNGLYTVLRNSKRHRIYYEVDIERLFVIRSLRGTNFSYASILRFFQHIAHKEQVDTKDIFNQVEAKDEIIHAADRLELSIREAISDTQEMISMIKEYLEK